MTEILGRFESAGGACSRCGSSQSAVGVYRFRHARRLGNSLDYAVVEAIEREFETIGDAQLVIHLAQIVLDHLFGGCRRELRFPCSSFPGSRRRQSDSFSESVGLWCRAGCVSLLLVFFHRPRAPTWIPFDRATIGRLPPSAGSPPAVLVRPRAKRCRAHRGETVPGSAPVGGSCRTTISFTRCFMPEVIRRLLRRDSTRAMLQKSGLRRKFFVDDNVCEALSASRPTRISSSAAKILRSRRGKWPGYRRR